MLRVYAPPLDLACAMGFGSYSAVAALMSAIVQGLKKVLVYCPEVNSSMGLTMAWVVLALSGKGVCVTRAFTIAINRKTLLLEYGYCVERIFREVYIQVSSSRL